MSDVGSISLSVDDANVLRKWGSLWADLLHVDMALLQLNSTPTVPANIFTRRALWESAIVSYGRMAMSDRVRGVEYRELLEACGGESAMAVHERAMDWRHGHVAHRRNKEFEAVDVLASFDGEGLASVQLTVTPVVDPKGDGGFVEEFTGHVERLRNALWERYLAPLAERLVARVRADSSILAASFAPSPGDESFVLTLTLWARSNGTGIA